MPMAPPGAIFACTASPRQKQRPARLHWPPCPLLSQVFPTRCVRCATRATTAPLHWAKLPKTAGAWTPVLHPRCWHGCLCRNADSAASALPALAPALLLKHLRRWHRVAKTSKGQRSERRALLRVRVRCRCCCFTREQCCAHAAQVQVQGHGARLRRTLALHPSASFVFFVFFVFFVSLPPCANFWE